MTRSIQVEDIQVPRGRREPSAERVASLAASFREVGQLQPVGLTADDRLVYGLTRLRAAEQVGWKTIEAVIINGNDLQLELAEIDENLERRQMTALEEAQALARRKEIYEALHPEAKHGGPRKNIGENQVDIMSTCSFAEETAEKLGKTARTVRRAVQVGENLTPEAAAILGGSPAEDNRATLAQIAKLPSKEQPAAAKRATSGKPVKPGQPRQNPQLWSEVEGLYGRALNRLDELNRRHPHGVLHRALITQTKQCMASLKSWKEAVR